MRIPCDEPKAFMNLQLRELLDIALLRRDPGILPASGSFVLTMALAYALASALQSWALYGPDRILLRTAADLGLTLAAFWLLLTVTSRGHRFPQAISAVLGTAVLLAPVVLLLLALKGPAETHYAVALLAWAGSVGVIVWYTLIVGRVLQGALDVGFVTGIAIALAFLIGSAALLAALFPEAP